VFLKGIWKLRGLVFVTVIILFLSGCRTVLSREVIDDVGVDNTTDFQFYISKNLILERVANESDSAITTTGIGQVTKKNIRNRIVISRNTPGIFADWDVVGVSLYISFEEGESIYFNLDKQKIPSNKQKRKFSLQVNEIRNKTDKKIKGEIRYGGDIYNVKYSGTAPYLKVRIERQRSNELKTRKVKGRTIQ